MEKIFNKAKEKTIWKRFGSFVFISLIITITATYFLNGRNTSLFFAVFAGSVLPTFIRLLSDWLIKYKITDNNMLTTTWGATLCIEHVITIITSEIQRITLVCVDPDNNKSYRRYYTVENKKNFIDSLLQINPKITIETEE